MKVVIVLIISLLFALLCTVSCTDENVTEVKNSDVGNTIYTINNGEMYLRKVSINGCYIFFVTDEKGKIIAGTSTNYTIRSQSNMSNMNVSSVVGGYE